MDDVNFFLQKSMHFYTSVRSYEVHCSTNSQRALRSYCKLLLFKNQISDFVTSVQCLQDLEINLALEAAGGASSTLQQEICVGQSHKVPSPRGPSS